jgi:hypothetical protein
MAIVKSIKYLLQLERVEHAGIRYLDSSVAIQYRVSQYKFDLQNSFWRLVGLGLVGLG